MVSQTTKHYPIRKSYSLGQLTESVFSDLSGQINIFCLQVWVRVYENANLLSDQ